MKYLLIMFIIMALLISGCTSSSDSPIRTIEPSKTPSAQSENPPSMTDTSRSDKINDTTFAGELTELTDTTITIVMDKKTTETFDLNERAKRDIEILKIEVGNRIIITFDSPETRNITSVQKIRSEV